MSALYAWLATLDPSLVTNNAWSMAAMGVGLGAAGGLFVLLQKGK